VGVAPLKNSQNLEKQKEEEKGSIFTTYFQEERREIGWKETPRYQTHHN